jgi:hypothetical protein
MPTSAAVPAPKTHAAAVAFRKIPRAISASYPAWRDKRTDREHK